MSFQLGMSEVSTDQFFYLCLKINKSRPIRSSGSTVRQKGQGWHNTTDDYTLLGMTFIT